MKTIGNTSPSPSHSRKNIFEYIEWVIRKILLLGNAQKKRRRIAPDHHLTLNSRMQMTLAGCPLPEEDSPRNRQSLLKWVGKHSGPYRVFINWHPLAVSTFQCKALHEKTISDITIFLDNFHSLENMLMQTLGLSSEVWEDNQYQSHLCNALQRNRAMMHSVEQLKKLDGQQYIALCDQAKQCLLLS